MILDIIALLNLHISFVPLLQVNKQKLVNAKYCDKFPCVRWRDGHVVHVQVTPEMHRHYEARMKLALEAIQQR